MALQTATTTPQGVELPAAYHRIAGYCWAPGCLRVTTETYAHENARREGLPVLDMRDFDIPWDAHTGGNPLHEGYAHLKTLAEFQGAVDV